MFEKGATNNGWYGQDVDWPIQHYLRYNSFILLASNDIFLVLNFYAPTVSNLSLRNWVLQNVK